MKIKTQLSLLIAGIIIVPLFFIIVLPLYHYYTSPQRILLKEYETLREIGSNSMSENDWTSMQTQLQKIPPNVETIVFLENRIVISTMKELPSGTVMNPAELFEFIQTTSKQYDYQMQSSRKQSFKQIIPKEERSNYFGNEPKNEPADPDKPPVTISSDNQRKPSPFLIISRAPVFDKKSNGRAGQQRFYIPIIILFSLFETIFIISVISISRTISSSITMLEKNTQRIAAGELDLELEQPEKNYASNEITSLTNSLEKMRCSLKDDEERRTRFIMGLSHDLRTPVALIKGYTEAITDGIVTKPESVSNSLSIIHSKAEQLESMINDLINYVKLNNQDWRENLTSQEFYPLADEFAKTIQLTSEVYKRKVITEINLDQSLKIPMDKTLVTRVFENLFSNALRYTKENDTIYFRVTELTDSVEAVIGDTGIGIEEKSLEHIFDLFYRGTNSRRETGHGIGLSVVKNIVETHGWTISVKSKLTEGTEFKIIIPKNIS